MAILPSVKQRVVTGANKPRSYSGDYMKVAREAEEIVMEFLKHSPNVIDIEDWRELRAVHEADVDCAIKTADGIVTLAEIKSDVHLGISGNVLFEILRINHTCIPERACTLGWSGRSPATFFIYYAPSVGKIYVCRANALRKAFQEYTHRVRDGVKTIWVNTDQIKSTLNVLIPWDYCKRNGKTIFEIYDANGFAN